MLFHCLLQRVTGLSGKIILLHHATHKLYLSQADREILEPGSQHATNGQGHYLGICRRAGSAHQLDARLIELALPPRLGLL